MSYEQLLELQVCWSITFKVPYMVISPVWSFICCNSHFWSSKCDDQSTLELHMWLSATFGTPLVGLTHLWSSICGDQPILMVDMRWLSTSRGPFVVISHYFSSTRDDQAPLELHMWWPAMLGAPKEGSKVLFELMGAL